MSDTEYQPLKGDPDVLKAKAEHYANIADAIQRSVTTLHKIHDVDDMKSKATEKLKSSSDDVANDINKAHDRYSKTASALIAYSSVLREAQEDAETAIGHINAKQEAATAANHAAKTAQQAADDAKGADASTAATAATKAQTDATAANTALSDAQGKWHDAVDKKNAAAEIAIKAIVDVVDHHNNGLKNPSWLHKLASKMLSVLKVVCKWAGVLSIFLSWVPILGEVLLVLAAVGAVIDLVESVVKALQGGSWLSVLGALAMVVVTFAGGSAFKALAKNLKSVSMMKTLPKMLDDPAMMSSMRSVLKLKQGERMTPLFRDAMKTTRTSLKTTVKDVFKDAAKGKLPKFEDIIPKLKSPKELLDINDDLVTSLKLIKLNPELLHDPSVIIKLTGATAYQGYQTDQAIHKLDDPKSFVKWNDTLSKAFLGE